MKQYLMLIMTALFLLISCSDIANNTDAETQQDYTIASSLNNGDIISLNKILTYEIIVPVPKPLPKDDTEDDTEDNAEDNKAVVESDFTLYINLYDNAGLTMRPKDVSFFEPISIKANEQYSYSLEDLYVINLKTGFYNIEFTLYNNSQKVSEKKISFFISDENFMINRIESFPPVIYPNTTVQLKAVLSIPKYANPYLQWRQNGKIISSGFLSEGANLIDWIAPDTAGIDSLSLELYPAGALDARNFDFQARNEMKIELYITELEKSTQRVLFPTESYYTLFHFAGDTFDSAGIIKDMKNSTTKNLEAAFIGKPSLVFKNEEIGYQFDGTNGLKIPAIILPIINEKLQPFTLTIGIEPEINEEASNILICRTLDGSFLFNLYIDKNSIIKADIKLLYQTLTFNSKIQLESDKQRFFLSLSIMPDDKNMNVSWYYDGIHTNTSTSTIRNNNLSDTGITIIGGEMGFSGILDEFGVYYKNEKRKNSTDKQLFKFMKELKNPGKYILADGFDSTTFEEDYKITGKPKISNSIVKIQKEETLALPDLTLADNMLEVAIKLAEPGTEESGINLKIKDKIFLQLMTTGEMIQDTKLVEKLDSSATLTFKIDAVNHTIIVPNAEKEIFIPEMENAKSLSIEIFNNNEKPLAIDWITVLALEE